MSAIQPLLLVAAMLPGAAVGAPAGNDPAQLREMLLDQQHRRVQSQAALLLVQTSGPEAEKIIRDGLRQTGSPTTFLALAGALRLVRDSRFNAEMFATLGSDHIPVRQAAAETLAAMATDDVLVQLRKLAENAQADLPARLGALAALGLSSRKEAVISLLGLMRCPNDAIRHGASEALTALTGQDHGLDEKSWLAWWSSHKDISREGWLEERFAYQSAKAQRQQGELDRRKAQLIQLHQQYYARLSAADRLGYVQTLVEHEDAAVRGLAVTWSTELLSVADVAGQRTLADLLLRLSRDDDLVVQKPAVLALGRVPDRRALTLLRRYLRTGDVCVRAAAAHALAQQAMPRSAGPDSAAASHDPAVVCEVIPLLQAALDDPALEVVLAAAEGLGSLGVPEAAPVLAALLRHTSEAVRQTAAQALERGADASVVPAILTALDDSAVTVRFSLIGALGRLTAGKSLDQAQQARVMARLEELLLKDADPGVRSRSATVLGECGPTAELDFLWRRLLSREDPRVLDKIWWALTEIIARSESIEVIRKWDRTMHEANQGARRIQLLTGLVERWKKNEQARPLTSPTVELLIDAHLDQGKWSAALPLLRELLGQPATNPEIDRRLQLLLSAGHQAIKDGNQAEALEIVRTAQPFLARSTGLGPEFDRIERQAKP